MDKSPKVADVKPFKDKDKEGYSFGELIFTGLEAYQRAKKAQNKAKAEFWSKNPRPLLSEKEEAIKSNKTAPKKPTKKGRSIKSKKSK